METSETVMKEASPGNLKSEAKWTEWEPAFDNYLSAAFGVDGVPLNYIIRINDAPDHTTVFQDFTDKCVACAPLIGPAFDADKRKVHQIILSFTQGELSEDWLKPFKRLKNGRIDMIELRRHFQGEGNASRRIAVAERMEQTLHYRNERAMAFEVFLSKVQRMFNIFDKQNEPRTEEAKVCFLLKKTQCPGLSSAVASLKTRVSTEPPGTITFAVASNHLASCVSDLPDYVAKHRNISAVKLAPNQGIKKPDGSIHTGFYPNWRSLSKEQKDQVVAERRRKKTGKGGAGSQQAVKTELEDLKKKLGQKKRKIAALQKKKGKDDEVDFGFTTSDEEDAGDSFGGKKGKKKD